MLVADWPKTGSRTPNGNYYATRRTLVVTLLADTYSMVTGEADNICAPGTRQAVKDLIAIHKGWVALNKRTELESN